MAQGEVLPQLGAHPDHWVVSAIYIILAVQEMYTHRVKQSNMNAKDAGPIALLTSSGIGGAWFKDPSL